MDDDGFKCNLWALGSKDSKVTLRVVQQSHDWSFCTLSEKHVVNVSLSFVRITAPFACFKFKRNQDICSCVLNAINKFALKKTVGFAFETKVFASVHGLTANNICDY